MEKYFLVLITVLVIESANQPSYEIDQFGVKQFKKPVAVGLYQTETKIKRNIKVFKIKDSAQAYLERAKKRVVKANPILAGEYVTNVALDSIVQQKKSK